MSHFIRPERLPSGMTFRAPQKLVYDPNARPSRLRKSTRSKGIKYISNQGPVLRDSDDVQPDDGKVVFPLFSFASLDTRKVHHQYPPPSSPTPPSQEPSPESRTLCLPLLKVAIDVTVDGTVARTALTQSFTNKSAEAIPKARYTFPLYDGAVVTSFLCTIGNQSLVGEVKAKEQARVDFENAVVEKQQVAALLEEHRSEVFETAVGNIPGKSVATVEIVYLTELRAAVLDGRTEGLDVVIPMSIAPRYGTAAGSYEASPDLPGNGLEIVIRVNNSGTVGSLRPSSQHDVTIEKQEQKQVEVSFDELDNDVSRTQTVATYTSRKSIMDEDFVMTIEPHPDHPLQSRAVLSPKNQHGHAALMVNIKAGEIFTDDFEAQTFNGEIIFLIDRSQSMGWRNTVGSGETTKIGTLRRAMPVSLKSLPMTCAFNIVSFGTDSEFLWPRSQPYSEENVQFAMGYAENVRANMGGTELLHALEKAVESRSEERESTQIMVITDGEVVADGIIEFVLQTRKDLHDRVRFFALGIGKQVSHRLIQSIGEFGGGYGEVINVEEKPMWGGSLSRMLKYGVTPSSWTCDIALGSGFERQSLMSYELGGKRPEEQAATYVQAPYPSPPLHPFTYRSVFFLLDLGSKPPPTEVTLKPTSPGIKNKPPHTLAVEKTSTDSATIHHLAAKAALMSLETETSQDQSDMVRINRAERNAEKLGVMYAITSKWTSFVATARDAEEFDEIAMYMYTPDAVDVDLHTLPSLNEVSPSASAGIPSPRRLLKAALPADTAAAAAPPADASATPTALAAAMAAAMAAVAASASVASAAVPSALPAAHPPTLSPRICRRVEPQQDRQLQQQMYLQQRRQDRQREQQKYGQQPMQSQQNWWQRQSQLVYEEEEDSDTDQSDDDAASSNITLRDAVTAQDYFGKFRLSEPLLERLRCHFCTGAVAALTEQLAPHPRLLELSEEERGVLLDTLMVIHYFKTHMAMDKDLWDMMMDKAEHAVVQALQLSDEDLASLWEVLDWATKHAHFLPTDAWPDDGQPGPFPNLGSASACPACGVQAESEAPTRDGSHEETVSYRCPSEDCEESATSWDDWEELWEHQVQNGHVVCREDWFGNVDDEFAT